MQRDCSLDGYSDKIGNGEKMTLYSRRNILATSAAVALRRSRDQRLFSRDLFSRRYKRPRPHDPAQEAINPYDWQSLPTDNGNLGTLRHSFSQVHNRHTDAGWAREVTVRNFPISKAMAGSTCAFPRAPSASCIGTCQPSGPL